MGNYLDATEIIMNIAAPHRITSLRHATLRHTAPLDTTPRFATLHDTTPRIATHRHATVPYAIYPPHRPASLRAASPHVAPFRHTAHRDATQLASSLLDAAPHTATPRPATHRYATQRFVDLSAPHAAPPRNTSQLGTSPRSAPLRNATLHFTPQQLKETENGLS
jgi:hypothetical protein